MGIGGHERQSESRTAKAFRLRGSVFSTRTSRKDVGCVLKHGTASLKLWRGCGVLSPYTESTRDILSVAYSSIPVEMKFESEIVEALSRGVKVFADGAGMA